jgi:hypothetical protein
MQLEDVKVDKETQQAIEDWRYWVDQGYEFQVITHDETDNAFMMFSCYTDTIKKSEVHLSGSGIKLCQPRC